MKIIEHTHQQLAIRFGNAIRPAALFIIAVIVGLAVALYGAATDDNLFILPGFAIIISGAIPLVNEKHTTLTFNRATGSLQIRHWRFMVPSAMDYHLHEMRRVDAICKNGASVVNTQPGANTRCTLIIDFRDLPDYAVRRNLKRDEAADAVRLIRNFLEWDRD
ncbi:MAG: hypothetical protein K8S97_13555 [Anaerolineae bacterium]|nr:hypothetical protein [Anaerolineae bacterium]